MYNIAFSTPILLLILASFLYGSLPKRLENITKAALLFTPIICLYFFLNNKAELPQNFSQIFSIIFTLGIFASTLFCINQKNTKKLEICSAFIYAAGALGVCSSSNLFSLFIYWEIMAIASTIIVACGGNEKARSSAYRYAIMHFLGGTILLAGICTFYFTTNSLDITQIDRIGFSSLKSISGTLMLIGILVNVAAPPLSAWLTDSYPKASIFGSIFLSIFTTKTAIFVLLTIFPGINLLIYIGLFMIFYGIFYALIENNLRKILSFSIINQLGFMLVGIGIGTQDAQSGVALQAFFHIIYKALLFMIVARIFVKTKKESLNELGGLHKNMRFTFICFAIASAAICALPITSAFVSKGLIANSAIYFDISQSSLIEGFPLLWILLTGASIGSFLYIGRMMLFIFFGEQKIEIKDYTIDKSQKFSMIILASCSILLGILPSILSDFLPFEASLKPFALEKIITQLVLLASATITFIAFYQVFKPNKICTINFDFLYRVLLFKILARLGNIIARLNLYFLEKTKKYISITHKQMYTIFAITGKLSSSLHLSRTISIVSALLSLAFILLFI